jgi:hypothetical protein
LGGAPGPAFGASAQVIDADHIKFHYGQWIAKVTEEGMSNWRKLANLVGFLKYLVKSGEYNGFELFIFSENFTVEGSFWKGTLTSPRLHDLVLELRSCWKAPKSVGF